MHARNLFAAGWVLLTLLVVAIAQIHFGSNRERPTSTGGAGGKASDRTAREGNDERTSTPKSGRRSRSSESTIQNLRELGYVIHADRIGRASAEGSVEIRAPDGTTFTGEELQLASSGDAFFLRGGVRIRQDSNWMTTQDENAFVKISTKSGRFLASKARWDLSVTAPDKAWKDMRDDRRP